MARVLRAAAGGGAADREIAEAREAARELCRRFPLPYEPIGGGRARTGRPA
jgi:hypothetical protein